MIVIADTTPLNYLVLIDHAEVLPVLYGRVLIPEMVYRELQQDRTPARVQKWIANPPAWLEIRHANWSLDPALEELDAGEREAIALAEELSADLLILDDKDARLEASRRHLTVIGTLRVLEDAAALGLLDLPAALNHLQQTTFRADSKLVENLLKRDTERKKSASTSQPPRD